MILRRPTLRTVLSIAWLLLALFTILRLAHGTDPVPVVVAWTGGVVSALLVLDFAGLLGRRTTS